ncbi:MAG: hypothetical protein FD123_2193 [Bacteroidetes bacterium]|nr:MAG: hypothetical protein FD123_2193 [Bacteroidota bacterium]
MKRRITLVFLLVFPILLSAQKRNRYRWEISANLGAANFLGDLGGANRIGTNGIRDLELSLTRPAVGLSLRYRTSRFVGFKANMFYARVNGDDKLTTEPYRNNRNLNFRSPIAELSTQIEFYFTKERQGHIYKIKNVKGMKHIDMQAYAFIGVGGFFFNPQGKLGGAWYNLLPLHTEGQGLKPGLKQYKRINICIPIGIGAKYAFDRRWSMGLEIGIRKTFTDYIDDVSTVYFDNDTISQYYGPTAAYFADPSLHNPSVTPVSGIEITGAGQQRGDPTDNDSYMFVTLTVNYKIAKLRKHKPKF